MPQTTVVLDRDDMRRTLVRIAHEVVEKNPDAALAIVGIHRRGALLAQRLHRAVGELTGSKLPLGDVDISFYRDDLGRRPPGPVVLASHLDFDLEGRTVVIVDDVLYTGRTVRSAIEAIFDYGRPAKIQLAVMVDRGHRELPIRPDFVGKNIPTSKLERVNVRVQELDGVDEVTISPVTPEHPRPEQARPEQARPGQPRPGQPGSVDRSSAGPSSGEPGPETPAGAEVTR